MQQGVAGSGITNEKLLALPKFSRLAYLTISSAYAAARWHGC